MAKRINKKLLESVVTLARKIDYALPEAVGIRLAQKMSTNYHKKIILLSKMTGMDTFDIHEQVSKEARKRGPLPIFPGKDY